MSVQARAVVLIVHPSVERRCQLQAALSEHEVHGVGTRQEAMEFMASRPVSLVLASPMEVRRLLRDFERHAPRVQLALLVAREVDERLQSELVEAVAADYAFTLIEEELPTEALREQVLQLLGHFRYSGERVPLDGMEVTFQVEGLTYRCRAEEACAAGLVLWVESRLRLEHLAPGVGLEQFRLWRGGQCVLEEALAAVSMVRPVRTVHGQALWVGVALNKPPPEESKVGMPLHTLRDPIGVRGLLLRAVRQGTRFGLRSHEGSLLMEHLEASYPSDGSRLVINTPPDTSRYFREGDVVQLHFELRGTSYMGLTSLLSMDGRSVEVVLPRVLTEQRRRRSLRFRPSDHSPFSLSFVSPLTGESIRRPVLDLQSAGVSFIFDSAREVYLPGLRLEEFTLHLPDGSRSTCGAQVQSQGPLHLAEGVEGLRRPARCGLRLTGLQPAALLAIQDAFVHAHYPHVVDGCSVPFRQLWDIFSASDVHFPDYPLQEGPHLDMLESTLQRLGTGRHGLSKSFVYSHQGKLLGHTSGLRIYSRTWLLQHLAVRSGYHRNEFVSHALVCLSIDYAESLEDVEYLRGLWRVKNRWTSRLYGSISARMVRPGLTHLTSYYPCRLPVGRVPPPPPGAPRVRPATQEDLRWLEQFLRENVDVVRLNSSDLVGGELELPTLRGRFAEQGLHRGRSIALAEGPEGPLGVVLMEEMSPGLSWAEFYNGFQLLLPNPSHPQADLTRYALISYAAQRSAARGRLVAECLASEEDLPVLDSLGFENQGCLMDWTGHRSLAREWNNHLSAVFERLAYPKEEAQSRLRGSAE
jgi:hypothetical protein